MASMMEKLGEKFHGDKKDEHHQQSGAGYGGNVGGHNQPGHDSHGVSGTGTNYGGTGTNQGPYSAGTTTGQPEKKHEGLVDKIKKKKNPNKVRKEGDKSSSSSESD